MVTRMHILVPRNSRRAASGARPVIRIICIQRPFQPIPSAADGFLHLRLSTYHFVRISRGTDLKDTETLMKIASTIARILLGALFLFAGSNHIHPFLPMGKIPPGPAGDYMNGMLATGYFVFVGFCEALPALLLLINRYVPLALTVLAAVITNILVVDVLMAHQALPVGIVLVILWLLTAWRVRSVLLPLLRPRAADSAGSRP